MTAEERKKALATRPENLPERLKDLMAEATILANSRIVPLAYMGKPEAVFAVVQYGKELGIGPMMALQNIAFINGKPSLGSELRSAVAHKHPEYAGMEIVESTEKKCVVKVYRKFKHQKEPTCFMGSFSIEEAQKAGLLKLSADSAWSKWTKRMLFHRANAFAHQDAFPDIDTGIHTEEEMNPEVFARSMEGYLRADQELMESKIEEGNPVREDFVKDPLQDEAPKARKSRKVLAPNRK